MDAGATSPTPTLDARIRTASIVVLAIAMSVVMFAVVATMMATGESPGPAAGMLLVPLVVAALAALVASVMIRRVSFKPARILTVHANGGEKGLAELMFRITIVSSVLGEAVGIFGLILGSMTILVVPMPVPIFEHGIAFPLRPLFWSHVRTISWLKDRPDVAKILHAPGASRLENLYLYIPPETRETAEALFAGKTARENARMGAKE